MNDVELLVLVVPEARRDEIVDVLMAFDGLSGFTRSPVAGFSREHSHYSLRESVQGFVNQERFEMVCDCTAVDELTKLLSEVAGRDRFFYWSSPISRSGVLASG